MYGSRACEIEKMHKYITPERAKVRSGSEEEDAEAVAAPDTIPDPIATNARKSIRESIVFA